MKIRRAPQVFIASPLFNPEQIAIISTIENMLTKAGLGFYSARLHSGSDKLSPEDRKDIRCWDPVFESNIQGLQNCDIMIAVLEYAMPKGQFIARMEQELEFAPPNYSKIELPDAGTVWECGHFYAQGKPVYGFHTDKAKHLNLMLTHGCDGMIRGFDMLEAFLNNGEIDNSVLVSWDAQTKEVE